jgi:hypothetical protein
VRSKDSSNQILPILILYSKVSPGFAKGENLGLVGINLPPSIWFYGSARKRVHGGHDLWHGGASYSGALR